MNLSSIFIRIFVIIIDCDALFGQKYSHRLISRYSTRNKQNADKDVYQLKPLINYYSPQNYQYAKSHGHGAYEAGYKKSSVDGDFERLEKSDGYRHRGLVKWNNRRGIKGKQNWDINKPIINGEMAMLGLKIHLNINKITDNPYRPRKLYYDD